MSRFDKEIDRFGTSSYKWIYNNKEQREIVPMTVADMEFECADSIIEALKQRLEHGILGYTKGLGEKYRNALVGWYKKRFDWNFENNLITLSHGVVDGFIKVVNGITQANDRIIVQTPAYPPFFMTGRECVKNALIYRDGDWKINYDELKELAKDKQNKVLLFCHPHNPTGRVWSQDELRKVAEICFKEDMIIISDEIHSDLTRRGVKHIPFAKLYPDESIITCISASKTFNLAGLDLAHIVFNEKTRSLMPEYFFSVNPLSDSALLGAYSVKGEEWLEELRVYLDGNFKLVYEFARENFPLSNYEIPQGTYLVWLDLRKYGVNDSVKFCEYFRDKYKYSLSDGKHFYHDGFVRFNIATRRSVVSDMLSKLKLALDNYREC